MASSPVAAERPQLSYALVVDTARAHIAERGVEALSLRRVAAELGVTAPALYGYVADRRALIHAVAEKELEGWLTRFAMVTGSGLEPKVRELVRVYVDYAVEHPRLFEIVFQRPPRLEFVPATGHESHNATDAFHYLANDISISIEAGTLRADLDAETVLFTLWATAHGLASIFLLGLETDARQRDRLVETTVDILLAGLRPSTT